MYKTSMICGLAMLGLISSGQCVVTWTGTGGDTDVFNDANWDFGSSSLSAIDANTEVLDDLVISNATVTSASGAGFGALLIGDGFSLTLTNSDYSSAGNTDGISGVASGAQSTINLINSSMNLQFASIGVDFNVDGTSSLQFRGGGDPINSQVDTTALNLSVGAELTLTTRAEFDEQVTDTGAAGTITANGTEVTVGNMDTLFSFTGGGPVTGTVVPEPSSMALLGIGGMALLLSRRK